MEGEARPFYAEGVRFECTRCSRCCRHEPGYVFLSEKDLERIGSALSLTRDQVVKRYCRRVRLWGGVERLSLREKPNWDCIFWNDGCEIYDARPLQCRSYPFWAGPLSSPESWAETARQCPGIGRGRVHSAEELERWLQVRLDEPFIGDEGD